MKKIFILLLVISCYLMQIFFILNGVIFKNSNPGISIILFLITIVLAFTNIINAIITGVKRNNRFLTRNWYNKTMLVFKLVMIPFFILNFIIWYLFSSLFFLFGGFLLIPIGLTFTYLILLSSSSHVIAEMYVYYKSGKITFNFFIIHSILQLFFVIDIIDYIYVNRVINRVYRYEQVGGGNNLGKHELIH